MWLYLSQEVLIYFSLFHNVSDGVVSDFFLLVTLMHIRYKIRQFFCFSKLIYTYIVYFRSFMNYNYLYGKPILYKSLCTLAQFLWFKMAILYIYWHYLVKIFNEYLILYIFIYCLNSNNCLKVIWCFACKSTLVNMNICNT